MRRKVQEKDGRSGDNDLRKVFFTDCKRCGNTWVLRAVLQPGKWPICCGRPRVQVAV